MSVKQWVNLMRNADFAEDGISSEERMGYLSVKVKMKKGDLAQIKCFVPEFFRNLIKWVYAALERTVSPRRCMLGVPR